MVKIKKKKISGKDVQKKENEIIKKEKDIRNINNVHALTEINKINTFSNKRLKKKIKKLRRKEVSIFHFTLYLHFILDPSDINNYKNFTHNLNLFKPKEKEINFLDEIIEEINLKISNNKREEYITISKKTLESISEFKKTERKITDVEKFILEQINNNPDRSILTCRNLAEMYSKQTGKIIHKSQINNIMKNQLGLHYIKTSIKTNIINTKKNLLFSFYFIKVIIRALKLGFKLLFQDESAIMNSNNNYRCWRYSDEKIFFGKGGKKKKNLLLIIGEDSIIHYKINDNSTNEISFLSFMEESLQAIKNKGINNYIIIMDNLCVHKTPTLMKFYKENNINILFNSPYCSYFNCIELTFRAIKKIIYKSLFNNIDEVEKEVKNILSEKILSETLFSNFKETICEYRKFYEIHKYMSYKNFKL